MSTFNNLPVSEIEKKCRAQADLLEADVFVTDEGFCSHISLAGETKRTVMIQAGSFSDLSIVLGYLTKGAGYEG